MSNNKKNIFKFIENELKNININYEFDTWTSEIIYPYFVGEYSENEALTEDGNTEIPFILNGFYRGKFLDLNNAKERIKKHFKHGLRTILKDSSGIIVYYDGFINIPTNNEELKRIQINLKIQKWEV